MSSLILAAAALQLSFDGYPPLAACAHPSAAIEQPCAIRQRLSPLGITAMLGGADQIWWVTGDRLTLIARPPEGARAILCCTIQAPLEPIAGTPFQTITVRVPRMSEAVLDVTHLPNRRNGFPVDIRGADAPPAPPRVPVLRGQLTWLSLRSAALGEERSIRVYVPPDIRPDERLPTLYLADGLHDSYAAIAEAAARDGRAGRAIIVGISSADGTVPGCSGRYCDRRAHEYLLDVAGPGPDTRFGRHMRFVANELIPFIESRFPASRRGEDRIAGGTSNGGSWAFAAAQLRPDLFRNVLAMSSGSRAAAAAGARLVGARVYGGGGTFEPEYRGPTRATVEAAAAAGADTRFREVVSGHSPYMWEILFAEGLAWLVPPAALRER